MSTDNSINPDWYTSRDYAAIVLREYLRPIGGYDTPIFPPTFAMREKLQRTPYNIDTRKDGTTVCLVDSVPSQANRLEPIFDDYSNPRLVRKVNVNVTSGRGKKATTTTINLLNVGHRVADAIVRFSDKADDIATALREHEAGNSVALAKDFPTSIVFGAWNSRDAGEKVKRIVQSTIRAYDVEPLTRASQYVPPYDYKALLDENDKLVIDTSKVKGKEKAALDNKLSKQGLLAVPVTSMKTKQTDKDLAFRVPGGVLVKGDIRRDASINLVNLRALRTGESKDVAPELLRRYILSLSFMALLYEQEYALRQECQLVLDVERAKERFASVTTTFGKHPLALVKRDGTEEPLTLSFDQAKNAAEDAAKEMKIDPEELTVTFSAKKLREALSAKTDDDAAEEES